jgi:hypothetical protein
MRASLQHLPLELRTKIYEYIIGDTSSLTIPANLESPPLAHFRALVPQCLHLNTQILAEATKALHHHTLLTVQELKISNPADILSDTPPTMLLAQLHTLELTSPQPLYGLASTGSSTPPPAFYLHDLLARCPNLHTLTLPINSATLLLAQTTESRAQIGATKTRAQLSATTSFAKLLKHPTLGRLNITCTDAWSCDYRVFQPLEAMLCSGAGVPGLALDIEMTAQVVYDRGDPQMQRRRVGRIRYIDYYDFFG